MVETRVGDGDRAEDEVVARINPASKRDARNNGVPLFVWLLGRLLLGDLFE